MSVFVVFDFFCRICAHPGTYLYVYMYWLADSPEHTEEVKVRKELKSVLDPKKAYAIAITLGRLKVQCLC